MRLSFYFSLCLCFLFLMSCSDKDDDPKTEPEEPESGFSFDITEDIILTSEEGARAFVPFSSELDWQATVSADWLGIAPEAGEPGRNLIVITALTANDADESREAVLTLTSGDASETITVRQETSDYIRLEQDVYQVDAEGGILEIIFSTSMSTDELRILCDAPWLNQNNLSRAMTDYSIVLNVEPNPDAEARYARILFVKEDGTEQKILASVIVVQSNESTDYSADRKVFTLQKAAGGNGINVVLMGDAFSDRQIADGTYESVMRQAAEAFFSEEPYTSFKDLFNVYYVNAVSKNEGYVAGGETVFSCYFGEGTHVGGADELCMQYAQSVGFTDEQMQDVLIIVMMNSTKYAGTCWMYYNTNCIGDYGRGTSVAYFPIGTSYEDLSAVLHHEAGGHGFAKLADEYAYEYMGTIPDHEILEYQRSREDYGWWKNTDYISDPAQVYWSKFIDDSRYDFENIGVYEGACTYWKGAYRPTESSIMRNNVGGFNAPSREAIYYRIHKLAYGDSWTYDYEGFVSWDLNRRVRSRSVSVSQKKYPLAAPPVIINARWENGRFIYE